MGKTKQNGILHRLRRGIMCGALSCALALGMMLTMPGMTARAAEEEVVENIKYNNFNDSNDTCSVASYQDSDKIGEEVHIVSKVYHNNKQYNVTIMEDSAFYGCNIKKITIDEGLEKIGSRVFFLTDIREFELPASIKNVSYGAFDGCLPQRIRFLGKTPPNFDPGWLNGVNSTSITIEIPQEADKKEWESALSSSGNNDLIKSIQIYGQTSSSSSSSTTSSPNQEKNSDGEFIEEEPVNRIPEHVCQYEWEVVREVGADQDGLEQYLCKLCGSVQSTLTIPASHYQVQELYTKVTGAAEGETVTYDLGSVHTICDKLFIKLQERKNITLVITYKYKGENYRTTFPAGADYTELMQDEDQFYGMLGLNGRCGITTIDVKG